jgi:hypothetical protein
MSEPETEQQDEGTEAAPEPAAGDEEQEGTTLQPLPEPAEEPAEEQQQAEESQARIERVHAQLEKLNKHTAKRLGEILGDDAPFFETCEICSFSNTPGMRPSGPLPPEVQAAVYAALGQASPSDYQTDSHATACPECNGFGEVATGSKVQGQDRLPCVACTGLGWVPTDESAGGNAPQATPPAELDPRAVELQREGFVVIAPYKATA